MRRCVPLLLLPLLALPVVADDQVRLLPVGQSPKDVRNGKPRDLNDKDFHLQVPPTKDAWMARRQRVREQVLVANGLWPLPERTPLNAVIHGKIDRDEYTVEKVFFASYPGHYVCGNLYRPKGKSGKLPAVLCPHGHWANGRFYDAGEKGAQDQIKQGAEKTVEGARYPLQARCVQLARMGCVVFFYDMVGYADSQTIKHREGFTDTEAELRLQNAMGLQTWNSIRALDFLTSLPDVDPARVGVTGASGGGTQTFILCGIDDRPAAAFPAVMVSTQMQGGCICENCSYLRQGTGNIELAGLFAPKPLAMSGADDWTIDIERKGLPELKALYRLYGVEENVMAKCYPQFKHNYNQVAREMMYNWFNKHLQLGQPEPVVERGFTPIPPKELSVFDSAHPVPGDALDTQGLRRSLTAAAQKQLNKVHPRDGAALDELRNVAGTALRVMVGGDLPASVEAKQIGDKVERDDLIWRRYFISRKGAGEQVPTIGLMKKKEFDGTVVLWLHPEGKASLFKDGQLVPAARQIVEKRAAIFAPDLFQIGEAAVGEPAKVQSFAGYTFGYNRPLLANRVHDILTAIAMLKEHGQAKTIHLLAWDAAGPWTALARALCPPDVVTRTALDCHQFRFEKVQNTSDPMMLPGALKYGGLPAFTAVTSPGELFLHNHRDTGIAPWVQAAYKANGTPDRLAGTEDKADPEKVIEWLLR